MSSNILITGVPGVGKTTVIKALVGRFLDREPLGFYTSEIRRDGIRRGFELIDLNGDKLTIAQVSFARGPRVGKYGVDLAAFEAYLQKRNFARIKTGVIFIDEIGKMECFSLRFTTLIGQLLESNSVLVATIACKGGDFFTQIKKRPDVMLYEVTRDNRDTVPDLIAAKISDLISPNSAQHSA